MSECSDLIRCCPHTSIARFADELSQSAMMPRNTTFLTVLSIFSSVACRAYRVNYEHIGSQPLSINFCGEQPPAAAKSRVLSEAQKPVIQEAMRESKVIRKDIAEKQDAIDRESDKNLEKQLKSELKQMQQRLSSMFEFITDATPEALDMSLSHSNGYYSIASAEQGAINTLMGVSYSDSKSVANRDLVLKGFNGEWHSSKRKSRDGFTGYVVGAISAIAQDGMIENLLKASDTSGVIERFMLWAEPTLLGERDHTCYHKMNGEVVCRYYSALVGLYGKITNMDYNDLPAMSLSVRSWDKIKLRRNELEPTIANDGENANTLLRGMIGKYDIHVMKIAACLHLSNDDDNLLIHDDRVKEAMAIVDLYILHIKSLISESAIVTFSERERAVIEYIKPKRRVIGAEVIRKLSRRKCFIRGKSRDTEAVKETIESLAERDFLNITKKPSDPLNDAMIALA
ncbi:DUF3987 domain-containing protein [Vibrio sp. WJH972]